MNNRIRLLLFISLFTIAATETVLAYAPDAPTDPKSKQQADSLFKIADGKLDTGKFAEALIFFEKSLPIYQKLNQQKEVGKTLNGIATAFSYQGNYVKALQFFDKSKTVYQKIGDKKGTAAILNNMGAVHYYLGNRLKALDFYKQAIDVQKKIGDPKVIAATTQNIGGIYVAINDLSNATIYYQKAYALFSQLNDSIALAQVLNGIGRIYMKQKNYPESYTNLSQSLVIANRLGHPPRQVEAFFSLGDLFDQQNQPDQALRYYNQCLAIAQKTNNLQYISESKIAIGNLLNKTGKSLQAARNCAEGLKITEQTGAINLKKDACECLYKSYKLLGNTDAALRFFELSNAYKDSLQSEEIANKIQSMELHNQQLLDSIAHAKREYAIQQKHKEEVQKKEQQRNIIIVSLGFIMVVAVGLWSRLRLVRKSKEVLQKEKDHSEALLLNILPKEIADELKEKGSVNAKDFSTVSILFSDFKSFTQTAEKMSPQQLVEEINGCFKAFDLISGKYNIEKIKTIGDAYMAASGLPKPDQHSTQNIVLAAIEMQDFIAKRKIENEAAGKPAFEMRIGIHAGPVVAGVVGVKKFQYDVWGDTVNTASRMESNGQPGKVNVSETIFNLLKDNNDFTFEYRGVINAKGKGDIAMYFVEATKVAASNNRVMA